MTIRIEDDWAGDEHLLDRMTPEFLAELSAWQPGNQAKCPNLECGKAIDAPDMRERDDNPATMDYHCPHCGHCIAANFPKAKSLGQWVEEHDS
jgi:DNA-directed RNA polymerase subunit RPC12/RpoP